MSQIKIETGFLLLEKAIEKIQKSLNSSFIDAYIENGENMNDDYQVRVLDDLPDSKTKAEIETHYHEFQALEMTVEEKRKISQLLLLKGAMKEPLQPNHQLTPDALGFLFVYLVEELTAKDDKKIAISDLTVGMGNLLLTIMSNLQTVGYDLTAFGADVDDSLLTVAAVNSEWLGVAMTLFHQDSLQHLLLDPVDVTVADLPIGYYPDDQQAEKFVVGKAGEHTYAHHLLMEQSMTYVKEAGYGIFLVPSNFLETDQAPELKKWLLEKVYLQGILRLPSSLFKDKQSQKSIIIVQNHGENSQQAKEVLLAEVPSLKDEQKLPQFFKEFNTWKSKNLV